MRRQIYVKRCIYCDQEVGENLLEHMLKEKHEKLPESHVWNQPEYYFPMYETDSFLYKLDANSDSEDDSGTPVENLIDKMYASITLYINFYTCDSFLLILSLLGPIFAECGERCSLSSRWMFITLFLTSERQFCLVLLLFDRMKKRLAYLRGAI